MISIVVPTLTGREKTLKRCLAAYKKTSPASVEIIVIRDKPSWPTACNLGAKQATGDILHFTADDLEPLPGWHREAVKWLKDHDELPAPKVFNYKADGVWDNEIDGPDKAIPQFTRIPLMTRGQYDRIGAWPQFNYVADIWLSAKARTLGIETRMIHSYAFVHHWESVGRVDSPEELVKASNRLKMLRAQM